MILNILQYIGQPIPTKNYPAQIVSSAEVAQPCSRAIRKRGRGEGLAERFCRMCWIADNTEIAKKENELCLDSLAHQNQKGECETEWRAKVINKCLHLRPCEQE